MYKRQIGFRNIANGNIIGTVETIYGVMTRMDVVDSLRGGNSFIQIAVEDEISLLDHDRGLYWEQATLRQKLGAPTTNMFVHTPRLRLLNFKLGALRGVGSGGGNTDRNNDFYEDETYTG